jgi:hypothetical protein
MPELNWGKGFFRVWVVTSLAWLSLVLFFVSPPIADGRVVWSAPKTFTIQLGSQNITYKTAQTDAQITEDLQKRINQHNADIDARWHNRSPTVDEFLDLEPDQLNKWSMSDWQAIRTMPAHTVVNDFPLLFGPPAILYGIGMAFFWIARGFGGGR